MIKTAWVVLIGVFLISSCSSAPTVFLDTPNSCDGLAAFFKNRIEPYQAKVDEAAKQYQEEQWKVEAAVKGASVEKMQQLFEVLQKTTYDVELVERAKAARAATSGMSNCPWKSKIDRATQLLETSVLTKPEVIEKEKENQKKQDEIVQKSNAFRMKLPNEAQPVSKAIYSKTLGSTKDRKARESLYKQFNGLRSKEWLDWGFVSLIQSRNEEARLAGFPSYYEYKFFRNQLDFKGYRQQVTEVKTKLAPKVKALLTAWGQKEKIAKIEPWDLRYLREKSASGKIDEYMKELPEKAALDIAKVFYSSMGIQVDSYGFTMDLYPRPKKNTHAFAMALVFPRVDERGEVISTPKMDIRFLANLKKPVKWTDVGTIIHELGHAIHAAEVRQPLAIFRNIGSVETEAFAMLLERMSDNSDFLGVAMPMPGSMKQIFADQSKAASVERAFSLLRQTFFSDFEYEVYKNPKQDLTALWNKLHLEYWGVGIPKNLSDWDVEHFLMAPVYVQNYALGLIIVEQLYASLMNEFKTSFKSVELGDKLRNVLFKPGVEFDYNVLVEKFTGQPLSAQSALKLLD